MSITNQKELEAAVKRIVVGAEQLVIQSKESLKESVALEVATLIIWSAAILDQGLAEAKNPEHFKVAMQKIIENPDLKQLVYKYHNEYIAEVYNTKVEA